jgi:site-specific DNA-methyltransferase (adenine-specific)
MGHSTMQNDVSPFQFDYTSAHFTNAMVLHTDCFEWFPRIPDNAIHAVVTDPPYGLKEFEADQLQKRDLGSGGTWRIPPSFDGHIRAPLPRFTALTPKERQTLFTYFQSWTQQVIRILRPGGHVFIASNAFLSQIVFNALVNGGLEFRGEIIRLVRTLRGGDRPKNAEARYPQVCTLPRGGYEPWGLFRKPIPAGMKVSDCLAQYQTGGLRRGSDNAPFEDVIVSQRTPRRERQIAQHPSVKPQAFLRQVVYAALPLGAGIILDPFMGSGSTIAAAEAVGYSSIGIERHLPYFEQSLSAIPRLAALNPARVDLAQMALPFDAD